MNINFRITIEKRIARRVVRGLLDAGYLLSVNNGGDEHEIPWSTNFAQVIGAMFATDEDWLLTRINDPDTESGIRQSFVRFVYGNDGWDVVCDYGMSLEPIMAPINEYADKLCERYF